MNASTITGYAVGDALPERNHTPTNVELFMYNAALWNAHRIHFDLPYATDVEGYDGLVIAGPQMGDWLAQVVDNTFAERGELIGFSYSNRQAAFIGETLTSGGTVTAIDDDVLELDLFIRNARAEIVTPGTARVRIRA